MSFLARNRSNLHPAIHCTCELGGLNQHNTSQQPNTMTAGAVLVFLGKFVSMFLINLNL